MGISSARRDDRGDTWLAIAGAVVLLLGFVAMGVVMWLAQPVRTAAAISAASELREEPAMRELERLYPEEHKSWTDEAEKALDEGASPEAVRNRRNERIRGFIRGRILAIASAPSEDMLTFTQITSDLEAQLRQESPEACAAFAATSALPERRISSTAKAMAGDFGAQLVRMAAAGERNPVVRDFKTIRPADAAAFMALLREDGIPSRELDLLGRDRIGDGSPAEQCDIAIRVHRAVAGLPVDQGARLQAYLLVTAWTPAEYSEEE